MNQLSSNKNLAGDQRTIFFQSKVNNKRKKRKGKKKNEHTLPIKERAIHILLTGEIKDYTHPKEVDPYWDKIYRQYEYLSYIEMYYRTILKNFCLDNEITNQEINVIYTTLHSIQKKKSEMISYLVNFMFIMYGSVIKSRFYGWTQYSNLFTSKFNEVASELITKLKFDPNKTRCSVYYYQAFWLSGLSIINDIRKELCTTCNLTVDMNRGSLSIPLDKEGMVTKKIKEADEEDNIFDEDMTKMIDETNNISTFFEEGKEENETSETKNEMQEHTTKDNIEYQTPEEIVNSDDDWRQERVKVILQKLLTQLNISVDSLYRSTNRSIIELGKFLKKKLQKSEIDISEEEIEFLKTEYLSNNL
ncbi:MAG: hypothetical protein ABEK17_04195 [Candidatus Aenigmatarchaeota archaeon]